MLGRLLPSFKGGNMNKNLDTISNIILVVCACIATTIAFRLTINRSESARVKAIHGWKKLITNGQIVMGPPQAPIKLVEFSDYQCPFCREYEKKLENLISIENGKIALIRYNLPLEQIHPDALIAAEAAECAMMQNIAQPFQDGLYKANLHIFKIQDYTHLARESGVKDLVKFDHCLTAKQELPLVNKQILLAKSFHINAVPTLMVDGRVIVGLQTVSTIKNLVNQIKG